MPFSYADFKAVCHKRAMTPAILTVDVEPLKATLVTEHNASFPVSVSRECYISVVVGAKSRTFDALKRKEYFGLSLLNENQIHIAQSIYAGGISSLPWVKQHNINYLDNTNAILCSLETTFQLGPNMLVVGHVFKVVNDHNDHPPLINYNKHYCKIDGTRIPVHDETVENERLR